MIHRRQFDGLRFVPEPETLLWDAEATISELETAVSVTGTIIFLTTSILSSISSSRVGKVDFGVLVNELRTLRSHYSQLQDLRAGADLQSQIAVSPDGALTSTPLASEGYPSLAVSGSRRRRHHPQRRCLCGLFGDVDVIINIIGDFYANIDVDGDGDGDNNMEIDVTCNPRLPKSSWWWLRSNSAFAEPTQYLLRCRGCILVMHPISAGWVPFVSVVFHLFSSIFSSFFLLKTLRKRSFNKTSDNDLKMIKTIRNKQFKNKMIGKRSAKGPL